MLSNATTSYNVVSISLVLKIMGSPNLYGDVGDTVESTCSSALLVGMVFGQLLFGSLGDVIGIDRAMALTIVTQVIGCIGSALGEWEERSDDPTLLFYLPCLNSSLLSSPPLSTAFQSSASLSSIFLVLGEWEERSDDPTLLFYLPPQLLSPLLSTAAFRFVLGIGCGGVYPLAANMASKSQKKDRGQSVALVFSMQGIGYIGAPILAILFISLFGEESPFVWRFLLGFGAIPGLWLLYLRSVQAKKLKNWGGKNAASRRKPPAPKQGVLASIRLEPELPTKLLGTAVCWMLFDVLFYGNVLFKPLVLEAAFGDSETIRDTALDDLVLNAIGLPGYFVAVYFMSR